MADLEIPSVPIGRRIEAFGLYLTLGAALVLLLAYGLSLRTILKISFQLPSF